MRRGLIFLMLMCVVSVSCGTTGQFSQAYNDGIYYNSTPKVTRVTLLSKEEIAARAANSVKYKDYCSNKYQLDSTTTVVVVNNYYNNDPWYWDRWRFGFYVDFWWGPGWYGPGWYDPWCRPWYRPYPWYRPWGPYYPVYYNDYRYGSRASRYSGGRGGMSTSGGRYGGLSSSGGGYGVTRGSGNGGRGDYQRYYPNSGNNSSSSSSSRNGRGSYNNSNSNSSNYNRSSYSGGNYGGRGGYGGGYGGGGYGGGGRSGGSGGRR